MLDMTAVRCARKEGQTAMIIEIAHIVPQLLNDKKAGKVHGALHYHGITCPAFTIFMTIFLPLAPDTR